MKDYILTELHNARFSIAYHAEHDAWRKRRGQWKALCRLVEEDASNEELFDAACAAGVTPEELYSMKMQFAHKRDEKIRMNNVLL